MKKVEKLSPCVYIFGGRQIPIYIKFFLNKEKLIGNFTLTGKRTEIAK